MKLAGLKMANQKCQHFEGMELCLTPTFVGHGRLRRGSRFSVSGSIYGDINVEGWWFHYAQAVVKRVNKFEMKDDYRRYVAVTETDLCAAYVLIWCCASTTDCEL